MGRIVEFNPSSEDEIVSRICQKVERALHAEFPEPQGARVEFREEPTLLTAPPKIIETSAAPPQDRQYNPLVLTLGVVLLFVVLLVLIYSWYV